MLLTYLSLTVLAQPEDHLEPTDGYFNMHAHHYEYYPFIYKHLLKDLSGRPVAQMLTLPSRTPESVVSIERTRGSELYKVIYKVCKESIWFSKDREKNEVITYEKDIDTTMVFLIQQVFEEMLLETRYYEGIYLSLDGVTYIFCSKAKSGKVTTPRNETKVNDFAALGLLMIELAKSNNKDDELRIQTEIKTRAKGLLNKLDHH